jgi:hypothetical protein
MPLVTGFETQTGRRLAAEFQSRAFEAAEITAQRVEIDIQRALAEHTDTGATRAGVSVEAIGGPGISGFRNVQIIAVSKAKSSEWLDRGTDTVTRPNGGVMPVGARSPNRRNAPVKGVTSSYVVSGQPATRFFSAPTGVPLAEHMRNVFYGAWRRLR